MRIMKARKEMGNNQLIQEVIEQGKSLFVPSIDLIKSSINILIEKQYLDLNPQKPDIYLYVA